MSKTDQTQQIETVPDVSEAVSPEQQLVEKVGAHQVSRRDVLKAGWSVPVIMAASPPLTILAGSGGDDKPPPDGEWNKSSIQVTASCDGGVAVFTIENVGDGDMTGYQQWRVYIDGEEEPFQTGYFKLDHGESIEVRIESYGTKLRLIADQHPEHPGNSEPQADISCGSPTNSEEN